MGTSCRRVESRKRRTLLQAISGEAAGPRAATYEWASFRQTEQTNVVPPVANGSDAASQVRGASLVAARKQQSQ
jgi:hypothetical protein